MPDYKVNDWSYNFNSGNLTVNSIEAKQIKIGGALVSTENKDVLVVPQIQIGNLLLSEDENGNLKITSVKTVRLTEE